MIEAILISCDAQTRAASDAQADRLDAEMAVLRGGGLGAPTCRRFGIAVIAILVSALRSLRDDSLASRLVPRLLIVAGDHHGPIGALAARGPGAGDADLGRVVQQQVLA